MSHREESIRQAFQYLNENPNLSVKFVAVVYGIPRTMLHYLISLQVVHHDGFLRNSRNYFLLNNRISLLNQYMG